MTKIAMPNLTRACATDTGLLRVKDRVKIRKREDLRAECFQKCYVEWKGLTKERTGMGMEKGRLTERNQGCKGKRNDSGGTSGVGTHIQNAQA